MKRYKDIYSKICDIENIKLAHKKARKDKTHYSEVKQVDENIDYYCEQIHQMLVNKTYEVGKYKVKTINDRNKERLIMKLPYYPDRIIQWTIMLQLEQYFVKNFCYHSCASIPKAGNARIHKLMNKYRVLYNYDYCLELDIKKFYPNIDRKILKSLLAKKFKDKDLLWLLYKIIDSSPIDSNSLQDEYIRGIPIGSYLSQYLANFYLSSLDHWLKEEKHQKAVIRYMDNIIILGNNKEELAKLNLDVELFLWNNLHLVLKENYQIYPIESRLINFIGYRYAKEYTKLSKGTCNRFKNLCMTILKNKHCTEHEYKALNSYYGILKWCDATNLWNKYYNMIKPILIFQRYNIKPFHANKTKRRKV